MKKYLALSAMAIALALTLTGCGGGGGGGAAVVSSNVAVSIPVGQQSTVDLDTGHSFTFSANVTGTTNPAMTWSANGGFIMNDGSYIAPTTPGTYAVTGRSVADPSKSVTYTVIVTTPVPDGPPAPPGL